MKTNRVFAAVVLVLAVLIVSIPQSSAQTMYACVNNKSGAMRYVTGPNLCSKTEKQISWNITGPAGQDGKDGAPGSQGPPGPGQLRVVDSEGTEVGMYYFYSGAVVREVDGMWMAFGVSEEGFNEASQLGCYYTGTDCQGTCYFRVGSISGPSPRQSLVRVGLIKGGTIYYYEVSDAVAVTTQSYVSGSCFNSTETFIGVPLRTLDFSTVLGDLVPPFSLVQ